MPCYYIGLMSGTSIDSLDGALCDFENGARLTAFASRAWSGAEASLLHRLCGRSDNELEEAAAAANLIARASAEVAGALLERAGLEGRDIIAIGSHGQTVRHCPARGFSLQLDNAPLTAVLTGIDVVSNFRAADLARGGEGAPLTPLFHQRLFACAGRTRYVLNLGGIANLTVLAPGGAIIAGFDTGPANTLMDLACRTLAGRPYDKDGELALAGRIRTDWLEKLLAHPYVRRSPPKSTGRETFNAELIRGELALARADPRLVPDLLATLCEFTVLTASAALRAQAAAHALPPGDLILCGGGARNPLILRRLEACLSGDGVSVRTAEEFGVDCQALEAQSFAYFAKRFTDRTATDLGAVTGAQGPAVLGELAPAPEGAYRRALLKPLR